MEGCSREHSVYRVYHSIRSNRLTVLPGLDLCFLLEIASGTKPTVPLSYIRRDSRFISPITGRILEHAYLNCSLTECTLVEEASKVST